MPKFTLEKATWTGVEVEVPEKCPACGASFVGHDSALLEWDWHDVRFSLGIDASGKLDTVPNSFKDGGDDYHPFLLMCKCDNWSIESS